MCLGFLGRKDPNDENVVGVEGIERSMEDYLRGIDGFRHIERDRTGREIVIYRGQEQAPRHGMNVQLTIDMSLQAILEAELDNAFRELKPDNATGIIVDPKTGEILAMTSRPTFDLNQINAAKARGDEKPGDLRYGRAGLHVQDRRSLRQLSPNAWSHERASSTARTAHSPTEAASFAITTVTAK